MYGNLFQSIQPTPPKDPPKVGDIVDAKRVTVKNGDYGIAKLRLECKFCRTQTRFTITRLASAL